MLPIRNQNPKLITVTLFCINLHTMTLSFLSLWGVCMPETFNTVVRWTTNLWDVVGFDWSRGNRLGRWHVPQTRLTKKANKMTCITIPHPEEKQQQQRNDDWLYETTTVKLTTWLLSWRFSLLSKFNASLRTSLLTSTKIRYTSPYWNENTEKKKNKNKQFKKMNEWTN